MKNSQCLYVNIEGRCQKFHHPTVLRTKSKIKNSKVKSHQIKIPIALHNRNQ